MKHFYSFLTFLLFALTTSAQLDTSFLHTKVEIGQLENQQLVDAKRHYLLSQQEEKYLLKFGVEGMTFPFANYSLPFGTIPRIYFVGFEYRLKTGFSIYAQANYDRSLLGINAQSIYLGGTNFINHDYSFHIEPRWYLNKQKQVRNKTSGNNLSGVYASILYGAKYIRRPVFINYLSNDGKKVFLRGSYQYSTLNLGWQRRFGKNGFLHLQLGTGIQHIPQKVTVNNYPSPNTTVVFFSRWQWITTYKVGVGMAFGGKNNTNKIENIWRYHQSDMDMWKIDLYGLLNGLSQDGIGGKVDIGYERSIQQSAFSLAINLIYFQYYLNNDDYGVFNELSIQVAPRYYYNLNKRIQKGKTAHNLSADYFTFRYQWNIIKYNERQANYSFGLLWGMQRRIFKQMYVDYQFGYKFPKIWDGHELIGELKIGLAF